MSESKDTTSRDVLIEGHDYDGIQEYDNPMPGWWLAIFYITIAWSVFYVIGISVGWLNTYEKDLEKETEWLEGVRAAAIPERSEERRVGKECGAGRARWQETEK